MAGKLLGSRFVGGADNKLATKDVYTVNDSSIITKPSTQTTNNSGISKGVTIPSGDIVTGRETDESLISSTGNHLRKVVKSNGVTTAVVLADPNTPVPKITGFRAFSEAAQEDINKEISKLPEDFGKLLNEGLYNPEQQKMLMSGGGLLSAVSSKTDFTGYITKWSNAAGININRTCSAVSGANANFFGGGRSAMAQFITLLGLLAKMIECYIHDGVNSVIQYVPDEGLRKALSLFSVGKVLNPVGVKKKELLTTAKTSLNNSTKVNISKRLVGKSNINLYNTSRITRPGITDVRENSQLSRDVESNNRQGLDIDTLNTLLDYTSIADVRDAYPTISSDILKYYRLPIKKAYTLESEYTKLTGVLFRINPNWATHIRDGVLVSNISVFLDASRDSITLLSIYDDSDYVTEALIAKSYNNQSVDDLLLEKYPLLAV